MLTELKSPAGRPRSLSHFSVKPIASAVAALKILLWRSLGMNEIAVEIHHGNGDGEPAAEPLLLRTSWEDNPTVAVALRRVTFALKNAAFGQKDLPDANCRVELVWNASQKTKSDAQRIGVAVEFVGGKPFSASFSQTGAKSSPMFTEERFLMLLTGLESHSHLPVGEIPLLSVAERELLDRWSGEPHDASLARPELLHQLFERQADLHPEQIAVICGEESLTYAELDGRANQLARRLRAQGVGRGTFAAILLRRSKEVYVAMLAIIKAGGAYVPLDASYPADRVAYILRDCKVRAVVTTSEFTERHDLGEYRTILLDESAEEIAKESGNRLSKSDRGAKNDSLAYAIYTSGSTGRPKGVAVEHRAVCNLVRAESRIYGVGSEDRVFQGFSTAFDASIEEIWAAFFAGATLVAGTEEIVHGGPDLARYLTESDVTVFSTVPTMLSMLHTDLPTVRLLILGGEQCPAELVQRWCKPGRKMFNTYGPTEATVIATFGECDAAKPVTIGRPLPNYRIYLLDSRMQPVPPGEVGEIYIGGVGLAREYLGRPDLTERQFVKNPFDQEGVYARLYKTGDLGRFTPEGEIEFHGRIDSQVKLRGFRIELSEIESVLMQCPEVLSAAVAVREDVPGIQRLVGYLVPRNGHPPDEKGIRKILKKRLPPYMIPCLLETVPELPMLPSGKVDRRQLPEPRGRKKKTADDLDACASELERKIMAVWRKLFPGETVSRQSDFFMELGGHSLLAARMVSEMRDDPCFHDLSVTDVYHFPTPETLAAECEERASRRAKITTDKKIREPRKNASKLAYRLCGAAQFTAIYVLLGYLSIQWLCPYFTYRWAMGNGAAEVAAVVLSLVTAMSLYPAILLVSIAAKWILIGRVKPGEYPLWGWFYFRWWLLHGILGTASPKFLIGTPLLAIYYRLLGAKIGPRVYLGTGHLGAYDLTSIGEDTSIGSEANLSGYGVEEGCLKIGTVEIGRRCYIGSRAMLGLNVRMEDDSSLGDLSLLSDGKRLPAGQSWAGSPARPLPQNAESPHDDHRASERPGTARRFGFGVLHAISSCLLPMPLMLASIPEILLYYRVCESLSGYWMAAIAPLAGLMFVVVYCLEIALIKWCLLGKVNPGRYPLESWFYVRKHFVDQLLEQHIEVLGQLFATLYLPPWYRLLGVRVGKNAEISTSRAVTPDMLSIEDQSFIADEVSLGAAHVHRGRITIAPTQIGRRTFVGNSAVLPGGTALGDGVLLGVMSAPPPAENGKVKDRTSWLGTPAIFLPKRQSSAPVSEDVTYRPPRKLYLLRACIEYFRITLPPTFMILLGAIWFLAVAQIERAYSTTAMLLAAPLVYLLCGTAAASTAITAKWILMGRYRSREKPLWCHFVWRTELVTALHERLADPFLVRMLMGTPLIAVFFRLMGAKIGRQVYMETTALTEFDLIEIGDGVSLNQDCTMQTHLFEDRIMKMSRIRVGAGCTVGSRSVVLYDSAMEDESHLGDLSLLMKGETLPAGTRWEGSPARHVGRGERKNAEG
jgi:non-ribosomal peptide synthetase-like protein